jgi:hypothetical protein
VYILAERPTLLEAHHDAQALDTALYSEDIGYIRRDHTLAYTVNADHVLAGTLRV